LIYYFLHRDGPRRRPGRLSPGRRPWRPLDAAGPAAWPGIARGRPDTAVAGPAAGTDPNSTAGR